MLCEQSKMEKQLNVKIYILCLLLLLCGCQEVEKKENYHINFDMPSNKNIPMPTGRSFYVSGTIDSRQEIKDNSIFELDVLDNNGNVIRHVCDL